jgi:hypothetical protein
MGNILSTKDYKPEQHSDQGMCEIGFRINQKIPLGGPFFIEGKLTNGIYEFRIYHIDNSGFWTEFFTFETCHPLRREFNVAYDGSIVKFVFETDTFEKELKHFREYSFDFSKSFQNETEFSGSLKSMPFLLHPDRKIIHLRGRYGYYMLVIDANHYEIYIVESSDEMPCGSKSTFKSGDTVIAKINVESSNFPFVRNYEERNLVFTSADEGFVPIPIMLPTDDLTLAQLLNQENSQ